MAVQTWLINISDEECAELLAVTPLGRVGVVIGGRPEIFPVNHVYDRDTGTVAFPTNDRTKLHAALDWPHVAYEVDGVDPDGDGGWSVAVVGRARSSPTPRPSLACQASGTCGGSPLTLPGGSASCRRK